jgi:hypothetical protein
MYKKYKFMKKLLLSLCVTFCFATLEVTAQNVGIGETAPTAMKLQVKAPDSAVALIQNATTIGTNVKTGLFFKTGNNYSGSIGTIGSGATFRMGLFTYGGATPTSLIERVSISDAGNVGIGKTIPLEKLDVNGDLRADTILPTAIRMAPNAGAGKVLTSDAVGNATWQEKNSSGSVGFGAWGDCSTNGISEYNPVADPDASDGDYMGSAVAISGDFAIVGITGDDVGANTSQGSACIYKFNGTTWVFTQKITDATGSANDYFGASVAINGNYAIVGIPNDDVGANIDQGSVNIYFFNGSSWVFTQKLTDGSGLAGDGFGGSVALSGSFAVIGANGDDNGGSNEGSASFYQQLLGSFIFKQKSFDSTPETNNYFGGSVSISGNYAIVGVPGDDIGPTADLGSASIFFYNGSNWTFTQKISNSFVPVAARFGSSVSISGNYLVVGAPQDGSGAFDNQGSANFYRYNGSTWVKTNTFIEFDTFDDEFGYSVSLSGDYAIVAAWNESQFHPITGNQGSATIYLRVGLGWQKQQKFFKPGVGDQFALLGSAVGVDGNSKRFVVGEPGYANQSGNAVFGKIN